MEQIELCLVILSNTLYWVRSEYY